MINIQTSLPGIPTIRRNEKRSQGYIRCIRSSTLQLIRMAKDVLRINQTVFDHQRVISVAIIVIRPTNEIDEQLSLPGDPRLSLSTARQTRAAGWIIHMSLTTRSFLFLSSTRFFFLFLFGGFRGRKWEKVRTNERPETSCRSDYAHRYKSTMCEDKSWCYHAVLSFVRVSSRIVFPVFPHHSRISPTFSSR